MGCLIRIFRLLIVAAIVLVALILLLPKFFAQAGNSAFSSNNSGTSVSGLAELVPAGVLDKFNKLQVSLSGLSPNKKYDVTLDPGGCANSGSMDMGLVTSDNSGNVNGTFSVGSIKDTSQIWFVDIHNGPSSSDPMLACSQLITNNASADASANNTTIQLSPGTSNENVNISQSSSGSTSSSNTNTNTNAPQGFPNTGVAPGSSNSYDNNAYPRKF